jgi:selenide, water dikinase
MHAPLPITKDLLLIGGGHSHALVARMWGMKPLAGVRVSIINPRATAPYSGMLPGFVAGHYSRDDLDIDLVRLARFAGARLIAGWVEHIDTAAKTATLAGGRVVGYDVCSVDIGITSQMPKLPGFGEHAIAAKPLDRFASEWAAFRAAIKAGDKPARAAVIGAGIAGVELALAMAYALNSQGGSQPEITLIDQSNILPGMAKSRLDFFRRRLKTAGVTVLENAAITAIHADHMALQDGRKIAADFIVGAAGARAQGWLTDSGLELENGFIKVDATLRALGNPDVFAVGDCAHLTHAPRPKAGVFAVREAPVLFQNLRATLSGGDLQRFEPQKDYLKLISLGGRSALADKWGMMFRGPTLWRLKDSIDRKFMDQFQGLTPMSSPEIPRDVAQGVRETLGDKPMCGGCGAKVGGVVLARAIAALPKPARADILSGPGDDAATLRGPDGSFQVISTDHLRAFTNDPDLMARIAAVHALGDIWAMGAQPQSALASITLPRLSPPLQERWLAEIMQAAGAVFSRAGAAIVGGHSAQGSELSIGFTVTGLRQSPPITKAGARPGDLLILTKPIGTGVILAGEMAIAARGEQVMAALASMALDQQDIAKVLANAHAMTDVTGFGLAGHLGEMARASGVGITLRLDDVPLLDGALALAEQGVRSSLYADNLALSPGLETAGDARADLLFDPQTAGGLLAAIPASQSDDIISKINGLGGKAHVIATCTDAHSGLRLA